ncbi:hypothetical protein HDV02_002855 [Globomyces sp. JEL0801]|nr:hypothetical protein HDV02_002855 [Globomyces sp. JEL0801]
MNFKYVSLLFSIAQSVALIRDPEDHSIPEEPIRIEPHTPGERPDWMKDVPNHVKLSKMLLPGTHDSGTYNYGGLVVGQVKTQDWDIATQLKAGIRYLDYRTGFCSKDSSDFCLFHNGYDVKLKLDDALSAIYSFLKSSPSEVILVRIKKEDDDPRDDVAFQKRFNTYISANENQWYKRDTTRDGEECGGAGVTVGNARGKIIPLWNSFDKDNFSSFGFNFHCVNFRLKENGKDEAYEFSKDFQAVDAFKAIWERSKNEKSDKFYDMATSFIRPVAGGDIRGLAEFMTPRVLEFLGSNAGCPSASGFVSMDYPSQELIDKIISIKCYPPAPVSLKLESVQNQKQQSNGRSDFQLHFLTIILSTIVALL